MMDTIGRSEMDIARDCDGEVFCNGIFLFYVDSVFVDDRIASVDVAETDGDECDNNCYACEVIGDYILIKRENCYFW